MKLKSSVFAVFSHDIGSVHVQLHKKKRFFAFFCEILRFWSQLGPSKIWKNLQKKVKNEFCRYYVGGVTKTQNFTKKALFFVLFWHFLLVKKQVMKIDEKKDEKHPKYISSIHSLFVFDIKKMKVFMCYFPRNKTQL